MAREKIMSFYPHPRKMRAAWWSMNQLMIAPDCKVLCPVLLYLIGFPHWGKAQLRCPFALRALQGPNALFTDSSSQHEGVGWGVSSSGHLHGPWMAPTITHGGGWVDPHHTAQEAELVALLHVIDLALRSATPTTVTLASLYLVQSLRHKRLGRFAPQLQVLATSASRRVTTSGHTTICRFGAHQPRRRCIGEVGGTRGGLLHT